MQVQVVQGTSDAQENQDEDGGNPDGTFNGMRDICRKKCLNKLTAE